MAPVIEAPPHPGPQGGPVVAQDNQFHIIAYGALPPELAQQQGIAVNQPVPPQVEGGDIDKSQGLTGIPSGVDGGAVDELVVEARRVGHSPVLLNQIKDTIYGVLIPGVKEPIIPQHGQQQVQGQQQGQAVAPVPGPNNPQEDSAEDPHVVATQNFIQAVFQYAEAAMLHGPDQQNRIRAILVNACTYISSIEPGCIAATLKFEQEELLSRFLTVMHEIASEIMTTNMSPDLISKVEEFIRSKVVENHPDLYEKLKIVVEDLVRHLSIAIAVPHSQLLAYLKKESEMQVKFTILLRSRRPGQLANSVKGDPALTAKLVKEFDNFIIFREKLKQHVLRTESANISMAIEAPGMIMSTIKPDTSVGNDYVMQSQAAMQQLILNYLFFIDSSAGAEQSGIRKADVATEPRLYFNKLPPNQSQAKDYLRSLVEPHGEIVELHVPYNSKTGRRFCFGFCTMATFDECDRVIEALKGTLTWEKRDDEKLIVRYANPKDDS